MRNSTNSAAPSAAPTTTSSCCPTPSARFPASMRAWCSAAAPMRWSTTAATRSASTAHPSGRGANIRSTRATNWRLAAIASPPAPRRRRRRATTPSPIFSPTPPWAWRRPRTAPCPPRCGHRRPPGRRHLPRPQPPGLRPGPRRCHPATSRKTGTPLRPIRTTALRPLRRGATPLPGCRRARTIHSTIYSASVAHRLRPTRWVQRPRRWARSPTWPAMATRCWPCRARPR